MTRTLGKLLAGLATVGAVALGAMSGVPAHAGNNGQQLVFVNSSALYNRVCIYGLNQYWYGTSQCIALNLGVTYDNNWWWEGPVTLVYYDGAGDFEAVGEVSVPGTQSNSDWFALSTAQWT